MKNLNLHNLTYVNVTSSFPEEKLSVDLRITLVINGGLLSLKLLMPPTSSALTVTQGWPESTNIGGA